MPISIPVDLSKTKSVLTQPSLTRPFCPGTTYVEITPKLTPLWSPWQGSIHISVQYQSRMHYLLLTSVKPQSLSGRSQFVPDSTFLRHDVICRWVRRSIGDETLRGRQVRESENGLVYIWRRTEIDYQRGQVRVRLTGLTEEESLGNEEKGRGAQLRPFSS